MADVKISDLPVVSSNTFTTIFPNVQSNVTNQIAMSGFNTNDFSNVVNLGTGSTPSTLTLDCSLGDVFLFTSTITSGNGIWSANTINALSGKNYYIIFQNKGNQIAYISDNSNSQVINYAPQGKWNVNSFIVLNGYTLCHSALYTTQVTGNFPY